MKDLIFVIFSNKISKLLIMQVCFQSHTHTHTHLHTLQNIKARFTLRQINVYVYDSCVRVVNLFTLKKKNIFLPVLLKVAI